MPGMKLTEKTSLRGGPEAEKTLAGTIREQHHGQREGRVGTLRGREELSVSRHLAGGRCSRRTGHPDLKRYSRAWIWTLEQHIW